MSYTIQRRPWRPGFTLGEVLLAILFISIAFFAFASLQQRLIYSSWKTELRNAPRESCHSAMIKQQLDVLQGKEVLAEQVLGVNPGLYHVKAQVKWIDKSASRAGGYEQEQTYIFETYTAPKRIAGWKVEK